MNPYVRFPLSRIVALAMGLCGPVILAQPTEFQAEGYLLESDQSPRKIHLLAADSKSVQIREGGERRPIILGPGVAVFECQPVEYTKALELFKGRRYAEALSKFTTVKSRYQPLKELIDGHATMAAYYELECLRKMGNLEGLAKALQTFPKGKLSRENQRRQLALYALWDAVRTENWARLQKLAEEHATVRYSGSLRAQIAYCHGLALEGLKRPQESILQYHIALTADGGGSEDITRLAGLRLLGIYHRDPEVQAALRSPAANSASKLEEARAVAAWFEASLGAGMALPAEFEELRRPASNSRD
jgi:hypothetical protein